MIKHYFEFITSGRGMKEVGEPEGFDGATFDIIQRLHGRDVAYAGGKSAFRIYKNSQLYYAWEDMMYELAIYGYNAEVKYHIDFNGEFVQLGEVDLGENRKTDGATYLEFNVVEQNLYTLFKKRFEDETTPELIEKLYSILTIRLKGILKDIENTHFVDTDTYFLCDEVERHIDNFEFLQKLSNGTILKEKWNDYNFNGDFEQEFNGYLDELYDTGDETVILKNERRQKLIWIG